MRIRMFAPLVALIALGLLASGCGDDTTDTAATTTTKAETTTSAVTNETVNETIPDVKGKLTGKKLVVCSDIPYPPLEDFKAGKQDEFTGFDIDLMTYIAKNAGGDIQVKVTPFDGIIPALKAKDCDVIASALSITDERKKEIAYSTAYYDSKQSLVVRKADASKYTTLDSLAGKIIGVQTGTTGADYAKSNGPKDATIKDFGKADELFNALKAKDIDAILQDGPVNADGVRKNASDFAYQQEFQTGEQYGFGLRQDDADDLAIVNAGIAAAKADGTYQKLYDQYLTVK